MKVTLLTGDNATRTLKRLIGACWNLDVAVAWGGRNPVFEAMIEHHDKLRRVVIGTHMYQTDPAVLRAFMPYTAVRCMPPDGKLFHPKVYLFELDDGIAAVVGSHNLTGGAFGGRNIEASVLIEGSLADSALRDIAEFINSCWGDAEKIDEGGFLFAYESQYHANRIKREALDNFHRIKKPREGTDKPSPQAISWNEFVRGIKIDPHHEIEARLSVLERAASIFVEKVSLAKMTVAERKAIAGTYGSKEEGLDALPWAWFGTMFGQGDFKNLINESPAGLSRALDRIPLDGDVSEVQFRAFSKDFDSAFTGKAHKGGVPTASRLLAMKRPDLFVAVNAANRRGICGAFGVAPTTLNLDNYWERIVIPTQLSPWWQHARVRGGLNSRLWDNRAALLDCIYYDPNAKNSAN
ncbi:MAG: hypothetical protein B7Y41_06315 [Hydrogenophilales bacterium 28-61-23]|nr:MAG: hypothetical protein B7Y41_06315 [Hydrogenophilales bacterium 28-61-23]